MRICGVQSVSLTAEALEWLKYLGVQLDRRLSFGNQKKTGSERGALSKHVIQKKLFSAQRGAALIIVTAY